MYKIIKNTFDKLPKDTNLFYGHEYTRGNLRFAKKIEVDNVVIREKYKEAKDNHRKKIASLPGILSEEYKINLFLRVDEPKI